jgi:hypothetical protein
MTLCSAGLDVIHNMQVPFDMREVCNSLQTILSCLEAESFAMFKAHGQGKAGADDVQLASVMLQAVQVRVAGCDCILWNGPNHS